ncbi:MAG: GatB/YqeY domain-containing protein [Candidatus Pacebacteria bacterium]|nr:GatB/YqeY domain-containing protein [Candidatus Paceibacterota bacterium]
MNSKERIHQDLNAVLKGRKELETSVLRQLLAAVLNKEKEKRYKISKEKPDAGGVELDKECQLTDEEVMDVISSEIKKRKESIELFERGGRQELADKEKKEAEILGKYLPEQLPEEEVKKIVEEAIAKVGAKEIKDMGRVMSELMPKVKGRAEGTLVSKIVKELLVS